jgi:hypothetical protein
MSDLMDWMTYQVKLKEIYDKRFIEGYKVVFEYSKLLITNLILINLGGIAAIPVIAQFAQLNDRAERLNVLMWPAAMFCVGIIFALSCGLLAHWNANYFINHSDEAYSIHIQTAYKGHDRYTTDIQYRDLLDKNITDALASEIKYRNGINNTQRISLALGILSAVLFIGACARLLWKLA